MALCALFAVAGCDGGGGGGGEGGDDNDNDDTSSEPATECPPDQPGEQDACQPGLACSYMRDVAFCAAPIETKAFCEADGWRFLRQVACAPLPEGSCDPVGDWDVTETGPFEPNGGQSGEPSYSGPFGLHLTLEDNNIVYIEDYRGSLSADGCKLSASRDLSHGCSQIEGDSFCETESRSVDLDFSTAPATGTVTYKCEGECQIDTTAPVAAAKQL